MDHTFDSRLEEVTTESDKDIFQRVKALHDAGKFEDALVLTEGALPGIAQPAHLLNLAGLIAINLGKPEAAIGYLGAALKAQDEFTDARRNLANLLNQLKRYAEAEPLYRSLYTAEPDDAEWSHRLASVLFHLKKYQEASDYYRLSIASEPTNSDSYFHLAATLVKTKNFAEAEANYLKSLSLKPNGMGTLNNLAVHYYNMRNYDQAETYYRKIIALRPDHISMIYNLSYLLLRLGRYKEAWPLYETRYHPNREDKSFNPPSNLSAQWRGEPLEGKSIAIWYEQGFGDEIQFIRYAPLLKSKFKANHVTVVCKPPLKRLFESVRGIDEVVAKSKTVTFKRPDYWTFPLSLPLYFETTLETIPNGTPYLHATSQSLLAWRPKLATNFLRVGLVWKGSATHANDGERSLPHLSVLRPLWDIPNVKFFSLQKGQGEDDAASPASDMPLTELGSSIQDFTDSAAIIHELDLLICVDTVVAHLAGAMGKPCWVLLPYTGTDWRWMDDRYDSPWYPSLRLFRQDETSDWLPVIQSVKNQLTQLVQT